MSRRASKRTLLIYAALAALLALAQAVHAQEPRAEIVFASFQSGEVAEFFNARFKEFEELTGIRVIHESIAHDPYSGGQDSLLVRVAGGRAPDVAMVSGMFHNALAAQGLFADIEALAENDPEGRAFLEDFIPSLRDGYRLHGRLYGLPSDYDLSISWYNVDYVQQAGLPPLKESLHWDSWVEVLQKLTRHHENPESTIWALSNPLGTLPFHIFSWQNGIELIEEDRVTVNMNTPEALEALTFMRDLAHTYQVVPPINSGLSSDFYAGKAAIHFYDGPWIAWYILRNVDIEWDVTPLPHNTHKATLGWGSLFAILADSDKQQEAWEFVKWFLSWEEQLERAVRFAWFPPGLTAARHPDFLEETTLNLTAEQKRVLIEESAPYSKIPRVTAQDRAVQSTIWELIGPVLEGSMAPESALEELQRRLEAILGE